jgi:hypothetical protein
MLVGQRHQLREPPPGEHRAALIDHLKDPDTLLIDELFRRGERNSRGLGLGRSTNDLPA